jgi:hypothetical protein
MGEAVAKPANGVIFEDFAGMGPVLGEVRPIGHVTGNHEGVLRYV